VTANDFLNVIHGYGYVDRLLHIVSPSVFSFFFLGFILLLCVSMCVCLCDYNTYYKCNNGRPLVIYELDKYNSVS